MATCLQTAGCFPERRGFRGVEAARGAWYAASHSATRTSLLASPPKCSPPAPRVPRAAWTRLCSAGRAGPGAVTARCSAAAVGVSQMRNRCVVRPTPSRRQHANRRCARLGCHQRELRYTISVSNKCSHPACRRVSVRIARSDRIWSQTAGDAQASWVVICGRADRDGHLRCGFRGNPEPPARRASCPPAVRQQPGGVPHFALSGCTCPTRPPQALHIALLQGLSSARAGRARSAACSGMASSPSGVGGSGAKPSTDADSLDPGLVLADLVRPA